ncbi:MAG TPA: hypothetical protein VGM54_07095 [Chthoniobacter sp.]|jgi:hypothetical protein
MNLRLPIFISVFAIGALHAQDKPATPKPEKSAESPKVLIFKPSAKLPDGVANSANQQSGVIQRVPEGNPLLDGPSKIVADFFAALHDGKIDEGYASLTKDSKIAEKPEELKTLKAKTREAIEVFGNISGFDFVESRSIGQRLVRATYVSQGKIFPLRWRFYFYKPENSWRLIDMRVDDKLTGIFDEVEETKTTDQKGADSALP